MFSLFRKKTESAPAVGATAHSAQSTQAAYAPLATQQAEATGVLAVQSTEAPPRSAWLSRLKAGLQKSSRNLSTLFTGTQIDDALYEELEAALIMSDAGVAATQQLLAALQAKVKSEKLSEPQQVRTALAALLTAHLRLLEKTLDLSAHKTTVLMVVGVNGAGKTTSIGKLTQHLSAAGAAVLLAAGDTFRAAAREQLAVWAERNVKVTHNTASGGRTQYPVEIISQSGADPAAVAYDAVAAGLARGKDAVIVDTAGRLPTQLHLMEELKKIQRVMGKAQPAGMDGVAPHEVLLVIDGNTGQNALTQVKAFHEALGLTGLIVTKLDGTAKGGVLAAIAAQCPVPVYFIGVGEQLEDLETFNAAEFASALLDA